MVFEFWNLNFLVKRGHRGNGDKITENGTLICREDLLRRIGFFSFLLTSREQLEVTISLILHYLYFVHLTTLLFSKSSFLFGPEAIRSWFPLCLVLNNVIRSETINFLAFQLDSLNVMKFFWSAFCTSISKFALKGSGDSVSIPGGVGFDFFRHLLRIYDMAALANARS